MTDVAAPPPPSRASKRQLACFAAVALALAVGVLVWRLSPSHAPAFGIGGFALFGALGLALTWEERQLDIGLKILGAVTVGVAGAAAVGSATEALELLFSLASLGFLGGATYLLARRSIWRLEFPLVATLGLAVALFAALAAYDYYYVTVSRDLMIADFIFYRLVSVAVATLFDSHRWSAVLINIAMSMKQDYSWAPAFAPGLALAIGGPLSRGVYQSALLACYATPALWALAWLARELARRAGMERKPSIALFALAILAVVAAYPHGVAIVARGMPDIGGLALYVYALRLADRLTRVLVLPPGQDRAIGRMVQRLALALALTFFAMFFFRRWYAFAILGVSAGLALEIAFNVVRRRGAFRWRETLMAAAIGAAAMLGLISPVLLDWLPDPASHDYATIYAAYRKTAEVVFEQIGDWLGFAMLAFATAGAAFMLTRSHGRLARLTFVAALVAGLLFLRVQTPYPHHLYLIVPAITAFIAAPLLMLFARAPTAAITAVTVLLVINFTPVGAFAPKGVFPTAGRPHAPRADLDELGRMRAWVDAHASPEHKVCGLGSSYTFSGQLIDELWQLAPARSPIYADPKLRPTVPMSDVDTVEGPPKRELKDCETILVGDPVQTHVNPAYQQTVIVPSSEMLAGQGIGTHYRRSGEVFHLEKGVNAVVFERTKPLGDADMDALAERWRAARSAH